MDPMYVVRAVTPDIARYFALGRSKPGWYSGRVWRWDETPGQWTELVNPFAAHVLERVSQDLDFDETTDPPAPLTADNQVGNGPGSGIYMEGQLR